MSVVKNTNGQTYQEFLASYNKDKYADLKPSTTSDVLIFTIQKKEGHEDSKSLDDITLKLLMVQRANFPDINKWSVPGGFIEKNETALAAANRELCEETGIKDVYLEQLYTWDEPFRDVRDRVVSISHMALVDSSKLEIKAGSDAKDARWFTVTKQVKRIDKVMTNTGYIKEKYIEVALSNDDIQLIGEVKETITVKGNARFTRHEVLSKGSSNIAFDHAMMIFAGLERLKNKVEYTDIAFNLLPEKFTIAEIHKIFQLTTGIEYSTQNFRKKYNHMLIETNETSKKYSPRPAKLFRLNVDWDEQ